MKGDVPRTTWPVNPAPRAITCVREGDRVAVIGWEPEGLYALQTDNRDAVGIRVIRLGRDGK